MEIGKKLVLTLLLALVFSISYADPVNINQADAETLADVLVGVGMSKAQAIVAYREENGKFYSAEELTAVRGIGESTIAKNNTKIVVK